MALVVDTAASKIRGNLENRKAAGVCSTFGPQGTRHYGVMSVLCTNHTNNEEIDLVGQIADEIKDVHLTAPEYLQIKDVVEQDIASADRALRSRLRVRPLMSVTLFSINQRTWTVGHVGTNRAWLFRDTRLKQLTSDHTAPSPSGPPTLERACGMHGAATADVIDGQLEEGDILLVTSPNIHDNLDGGTLMSCLIEDWPAKKIADEIINKANEARVIDGTAVTIIRIGKLPKPDVSISPTTPPPKTGKLPKPDQVIDRFQIERRIRKGRLSNYYKARDTLNDAEILMKFPSPEFMTSPDLVDSFINDEWLSKRQNGQLFIPSYPIARGRRSQLYSVYEYRRGENLARRLKRKKTLAINEVLLIAKQLVRALENMHADRIAHRDIRPENIVLDKKNKEIFLLGIDQQRIEKIIMGGQEKALAILNPHYMPPELFDDNDWGAQSDIFSTGVCLYQLACGTYPYGRIKHPTDILKRKSKSAKDFNSTLPDSFIALLGKACAPIAADRFQTIKQLSEALSDIRVDKNPGRRAFLRRTKSRR